MDFYQSYGALSYLRNFSDPARNISVSKENGLLKLYNINLVQNTSSKKNYYTNCKKLSSGKSWKYQCGSISNNNNINKYKMAPISEKRSPAMKENTKENISISPGKSLVQNGRGSGPEILDFRESWLQDMEMYKDHVKSPQALLTTHNHLHTVDGCFTTSTNKSSEASKRRARTKSDSDSDARLKSILEQEDGLLFKRAREDNSTDFVINGAVNANVLVDDTKTDYMCTSNTPHHSHNSKLSPKIVTQSHQQWNGLSPLICNNLKQQQQLQNTLNDSASHSNNLINHHQHTNSNHIQSNGLHTHTENGKSSSSSSMPKNIIVNPYHLSLMNTQETDKNKIVLNSVKNNNVLLQNAQKSAGPTTESHGKPVVSHNTGVVTNNCSTLKSSPLSKSNTTRVTNSSKKQQNDDSSNGCNEKIPVSMAPTYAIALHDINSSMNTTKPLASVTSKSLNDFVFDNEKINGLSKAVPTPTIETVVNVPENDNDEDAESYYDDDDDDEFLRAIDTQNNDALSSDESDEEYSGCVYYLNSDEEENFGQMSGSEQNPLKMFQMNKQSAELINTLLNGEQGTSVRESEESANSNTGLKLLLPEPSAYIAKPSEYFTPKSILTPSLFPSVPPYLTFSSHIEKGPAVPPELQKVLKWRLSAVMPKVVRRVVANSGFRLIKKTNDWMASWEKHMKSPCFKAIKSHQKFNHLPGTFKIGRKDSVWRNIKYYINKFGKNEFGFMQKSFILPQDLEALKKTWPKNAKKGTKWIIKPPASARGTGIKVVSRWTEFPKQKPLIVQKYIERPLLINGNKFDLRLYVVITSINPLRLFMHTDGLARFASVQYSDDLQSLKDRCMHLTNYSINKFSSNYSKNEDINACQGHKWTLKSLWNYFRQRGINTTKLWGTLRSLIIKTVIGGEGCLNRMYKANVNSRYNCYELFGFDVLLDENLIPWLLEVNISPSLHSDLPLDQHVKGPLIQAVLNSALYQIPPKLTSQQESSIKTKFSLAGPLSFDRRIYTTCLSQEEVRKHNHYTSRDIEYREEYLDTILDELTPDDVRCLIITEDELARSKPLERIFPSCKSYAFLKYLEGPRYYNRLLDAWETKFGGDNKQNGIKLLAELCQKGYHLQVPEAALVKEPSNDIDVFELNALYKSQMKSISNPGSPSPVPTNNETKKEITPASKNSRETSDESNKTFKNDSLAAVA